MSVPEYTLDCIADGEFHRIQEDELLEQIGCGNYELDGSPSPFDSVPHKISGPFTF